MIGTGERSSSSSVTTPSTRRRRECCSSRARSPSASWRVGGLDQRGHGILVGDLRGELARPAATARRRAAARRTSRAPIRARSPEVRQRRGRHVQRPSGVDEHERPSGSRSLPAHDVAAPALLRWRRSRAPGSGLGAGLVAARLTMGPRRLVVDAVEVGREVLGRDLARRRPRRRVGDLRAEPLPAGYPRGQVQRLLVCQQHSADDRMERLRRHRRARQRGDRLGHRVGLLGADAAVLDCEVGRVARRVHALHVEHLPVGGHADEAVFAERDAPQARAVELGQRDHAVDLQAAVAGVDHDLARVRHLRIRGGDRVVIRARSSRSATASLAAVPKIASGLSSGVTIVVAQVDVHVVRAPRGHQRELVERKRPGHAPRRDEREARDVAPLEVLQQPVQRLVEVAVVDRESVLVARAWTRAPIASSSASYSSSPSALRVRRRAWLVSTHASSSTTSSAPASASDRRQRIAARAAGRRTARAPSSDG